jgi:DNA-binding NtrC family response regulator
VEEMTTPWEVVVVSSDLESRRNLSSILTRQGIDPICTSTLRECREVLSQKNVGIVFCDSHVSDGNYKEFLGGYRSRAERPRVVVTSRHSEWDEFKEAIRFGAFDVIGMPCRPTDVEWMIIQARRDDRKRTENTSMVHVVPSTLAKPAAAAAL